MRYLILLLPLLSGCWSGQLKQIQLADRDYYMTVGDTLYKPKKLKPGQSDIKDHHLAWQFKKPEDMTDNDKHDYALLLHEAEHSKQMRGFVRFFTFMVKYNTSKEFRWEMESAAYRIEIETLVHEKAWTQQHVEDFSRAMSDKVYDMVTYQEANAFVLQVVKDAEK